MPQFSLDLEDINGNNGFVVEDASAALSLFSSVADYNGDGISDLVVTSILDEGLIQDSHIIYGAEELPASLDLSDLDGDNGITVGNTSSNTLINFNLFTSNLDFNGDGTEDLLTTNLEQLGTGEADFATRIVFGDADLPTTVNLANLNGNNGTEFGGNLSILLSQPININGDDADDLIISAADLDSPNVEGDFINFIVLGREGNVPETISTSLFNGRNAFEIDLEGFPVVLGEDRDVNDDGIDDLAINVFDVENIGSSSSILFGRESFPGIVGANAFDGERGFNLVSSDATEDDLINSNLIDDINGDGIDDISVSLSRGEELENGELDLNELTEVEETFETASQRAFFVYGTEDFDENFDLADLDGSNGFEIINSDSESAVLRNPTTLDLNNDELSDSFFTDDESGQHFVVFGQSAEVEEIDLSNLAADEGFALVSDVDFEITAADNGDFNGDGIDDLILETSESGEETDYVIFGSEDSFGRELDFVDEDANTLEIVVQDASLEITNIIDLNDDGADDLVYGATVSPDSLLDETASTIFPDVQVVFGDADLGAS